MHNDKDIYEIENDIKRLIKAVQNGNVKLKHNVTSLRGMKIGAIGATGIIVLKKYPDCLEESESAPTLLAKMRTEVNNRLTTIVNEYYDITMEFPKIEKQQVIDEDEELEDAIDRLEVEEFEKRQTLAEKDTGTLFNFKSRQIRPSILSFKPDKIFTEACSDVLNPKYAEKFIDFHQYNDDEISLTLPDGKISHYEDNQMNEALMFMVNKYCKKCYFTSDFELPDVVGKLIMFGSPTVEADEEGNLPQNTIEQDSTFSDSNFITHFKKFRLKIDVKELTEYIVTHFTKMNFYNFNVKGDKSTVGQDKNIERLRLIIDEYCGHKGIFKEDMFVYYSYMAYEELLKIYLLMFSQYYNIYHEKKVNDDLFTVKKKTDKKDDSPKNSK